MTSLGVHGCVRIYLVFTCTSHKLRTAVPRENLPPEFKDARNHGSGNTGTSAAKKNENIVQVPKFR